VVLCREMFKMDWKKIIMMVLMCLLVSICLGLVVFGDLFVNKEGVFNIVY